jgi:hypothetical protein
MRAAGRSESSGAVPADAKTLSWLAVSDKEAA